MLDVDALDVEEHVRGAIDVDLTEDPAPKKRRLTGKQPPPMPNPQGT